MLQAKFSVDDNQVKFLNNCKSYGFKDKSSMVRTALDHLKREIETENLRKSADLYADLYSESENLQELTDSAIPGWPE